MKNGHTIYIEEIYDEARECFHAVVSLHEYRQGRQYGGAVVWEHSARGGQERRKFLLEVTKLVEDEVLPLLTYKIK